MQLNIYAIPNFLIAFYALFISIFVFYKNRHARINMLFSVFCFLVFGYLFSYGILYQFPNKAIIHWAPRIGHMFAIMLAPLYYHFCIIYLRKKEIILPLSLYIFALSLSILILKPDLYIRDATLRYWGYYSKGGPFALLDFVLHGAVGVRCIILLTKQLRKEKAVHNFVEYNRLKYLTFALGIFLLSISDYIPKFISGFYPLGIIFIAFFLYLSTYCIIRHNLLDINVVFRKGAIYSILISAITIIYFVLIFLLENLFRDYAGYKSVPLAAAIITLFILIFQPLKNRIQLIVDKCFFRGSIDQIEQENIQLREELQRSEKLKAVGTLAAGMAHEIKNPLTSIKTFTEYLPKKYHDKEFVDKFEQTVGSEVNKIDNIVGQLLDFAKLRPLEIEKSDIRKLMDETLEFLSHDFIKYHINVIKNYTVSPTLKIDPVQIKQVFLNIILNAIESMKEKGGKLIMVIKQSEPNFTEISIEDTGYGINKKDLKHLFDPFFTTKETNTGLGLSIVHGIIEKHKGKIRVASQLGKGTKFTLLLPNA